MNYKRTLITACLALQLATYGVAFAQTAPATTTPTTPAAPASTTTPTTKPANTGTLNTIIVTGSSDNSVLPNDTPVSSVFGTDMSVQDTPRSVTVLSPELLKAYNVKNLQDLSKTAPSAYQTDQFGGYSVPNIRGQQAEVFINGQQRITRTDGPPTSFNSVESVDLINGPASSVYGPTAYTGGYVNFVTKQPYFDAWHSNTSFTYGSWDKKIWSEDFGAPIIKDQLAFRASYEGQDSGSYYNNVITQSQNGFFALTYKPSDVFKTEFNTEFQEVRFNENTGWNRPTQELIDNHNYNAGTFGFIGAGGIVATPTSERLSPASTNISPIDSDYGKNYNAQLTSTYDAGDGLKVINRTYFEKEELRNSEFAQYYANILNATSLENRSEVHIDFDTPITETASAPKSDAKDMKDMKAMAPVLDPGLTFKNSIITGVAFKYYNVNDYQGFYNEQLNNSDLAAGTYPAVGGGGFFNAVAIPGTNLYGSPGGNYIFGLNQPGSVAETSYKGSAFYQHNITFTPEWSLLYGGRGDVIFDDAHDTLPPAGFQPVSDNTIQALGSGNASINYKPMEWLTNYLTFSYSQSTNVNTGGGYATFDSANQLSNAAYHYQNFLYEGGSKLNLLNDTLFLTAAGYYQNHAVTTALGGTTQVRVVGSELQQTYQPDKHFYVNLNESFLDATLIDPGPEFTQKSSDLYNAAVGSPNFAAPGAGHYRESGLPEFVLNGIAQYKWDCGLGVSAGYQITDPIPTSEIAPLKIPWQYQIDTSVFYEQKNYEARLRFFNITDQHNFSTGGYIAGTGNDLITIHEPFHMEGTLTYKF